MSELRCFYCAGLADDERSLAWNTDGHLEHEWRDRDTDEPSCLPLLDGLGRCDRCERAMPTTELLAAEVRQRLDGKSPRELVPPEELLLDYFIRVERMDTNEQRPAGTRGVVYEQKPDGQPFAICTTCAGANDKWKGARRRPSQASKATPTDADAERLAKVCQVSRMPARRRRQRST